jgi:hypothetical protein
MTASLHRWGDGRTGTERGDRRSAHATRAGATEPGRDLEFECAAPQALVPNEPAARADVPARRRPNLLLGDIIGNNPRPIWYSSQGSQHLLRDGTTVGVQPVGRFFFDLHPGLAPIFGCVGLLNFGLTPRKPASNPLRQGSERLPCVGSLHALEHEVNRVWNPRKVGAEARTGYARCG